MNKSIDVTEVWKHQGYLTDLTIFSSHEIQKYRELFDEMEKSEGQETAEIGFHNRHFESEFIWRLSTSPKILGHVQSLIGSNVLLLGTHFFCKYPVDNIDHFVAWHQDVTYWGLKPPEAYTAWIAVDDSDVENGCMRVIPGSHKKGLKEHSTSESEGNLLSINQEIPKEEIIAEEAFDLSLKAGQISIHDGHLIHSSRPNHSQRRRCGLTVRFIKPEVRQIELNSTESNWNPVLVRGQDLFNHFPKKVHPF